MYYALLVKKCNCPIRIYTRCNTTAGSKTREKKEAPLFPLEYCTYICHISRDIYMEISQLSKISVPQKYDTQA